jgi:hypothetical protein
MDRSMGRRMDRHMLRIFICHHHRMVPQLAIQQQQQQQQQQGLVV